MDIITNSYRCTIKSEYLGDCPFSIIVNFVKAFISSKYFRKSSQFSKCSRKFEHLKIIVNCARRNTPFWKFETWYFCCLSQLLTAAFCLSKSENSPCSVFSNFLFSLGACYKKYISLLRKLSHVSLCPEKWPLYACKKFCWNTYI